MRLKRKLLRRSRLCVILDNEVLAGRSLKKIASEVAAAGADIIQLRDKKAGVKEFIARARIVSAIGKKFKVLVIVNDRIDVALASNADGVHIGQGDISVGMARNIMGPHRIIGLSVNSMDKAKAAEFSGADYLGLGPVFKTPIKNNVPTISVNDFSGIVRLTLPIFAIGGIGLGNLKGLADKGIRRVAVIRAVCSAGDPGSVVKKMKAILA